MSQVTNTTTGISNNNNNTPWNRTPGKPGIGTGSVVVGGGTVVSSSYPTLSTTSSIIPSWSSTSRNDPGDLMLQDGGLIPMEGGGAVGSSSVGQMWPIPGIFDANQLSDRNMIVGSGGVGGGGEFLPQESSLTDNQWVTTTPFSGQTTSNINSLLGSSNTFPINNNINNVTTHHNHNSNQTLNPWSFDNPTPTHNNNSIHVPRAITGQQLNNLVSLTNHSLDTLNLNRSRHYAQHWTTGTTLTTTTTAVAITTTTMPLAAAGTAILDNEQDLLNDDRSGLAFPLSSIHIITTNNTSSSIHNHNNSISGFNDQSDFTESQSLSSHINNNTRVNNKLSEFDIGLKKSCSDIDSSGCDTEEAIRTAVNTTEPWGIHPVDQSTPWNCADETNGDCLPIHSSGSMTGSPPVSEMSTVPARIISGLNQSSGVSTTIQPPGSQSSLHSRRLSSVTSSISRDLESNIWPNEPPNGTGIWESHYENLGERTARWHQTSSSSTNSSQTSQVPLLSQLINPSNFASNQLSHPTMIRSRLQQSQLPSNTENFRGINRPSAGSMFSSGQPLTNSNMMNLGTRPMFGANHPIGPVNSNIGGTGVNSSRNFPIAAASPVNLGPAVSWPYSSGSHPVDPSIPGINYGNKSRWPGQNMNRLPGKQQQQLQQQQQHPPTPHILPNITSTGMRWPPGGGGGGGGATTSTHVQGMWPMTDQRRLGTTVPGPWSTNPTGMMDSMNNTGGFFNQSNQSITPRGGGVTSEFPASLNPSIRGVNQAFRTPPSAFYPPPITPGFPPSTTTISSQRMFMNSQPHSHQLQQQQQQQQSMIRAHVIRQLFNLGFTEDEIQPIFADTTNTSMERALIDLRDRSGHPGIDELINNLRTLTSNLLPTLNSNDVRQQQQQSDLPGQTMPSNRLGNTIRGMEMIKSNLIPMMNNHPSQPTENLELSLQLLQQRETQILQTIVQLHSKHQDLNQKLSHIRSATNVPFATNPVIHELQLQAFQVSQQIDAQQAQLKHVRSQAGMLRQITTMSASSSASICQALNTTHNTNTTTITPSSSTLLLGSNNNNNHTSSNSGVGVGQQTMMSTVQQQQQIIPNCITGITNPIGNGKGFNSIVSSASTSSSTSSVLPSSSSSTTSTASWCGVTTQISKSNQLFNISAVGNNINNSNNGSESIDFLPDQTNFNMNSLLWESNPWSGSTPQLHENFSTNRNSITTDRRWTPTVTCTSNAGGGNNNTSRLPQPYYPTSQISSSLSDPRWSDLMNDMTNPSLMMNDVKHRSFNSSGIGELDDVHPSGVDCQSLIIPMSISNKSWLLAHNIPSHISVGMLKMTVSSALNANHQLIRSMECDVVDHQSNDRNTLNTTVTTATTTNTAVSSNSSNDVDFEIHPNMSARWVLLGLNNSTDMSIVHSTLEGAGGNHNSSSNDGQQQQVTGCYGSIKRISPAEALFHLQEIQSLASRLKGLNADGSQTVSSANIHSISQLSTSTSSSSANMMRCDSTAAIAITTTSATNNHSHINLSMNDLSSSTPTPTPTTTPAPTTTTTATHPSVPFTTTTTTTTIMSTSTTGVTTTNQNPDD